MLSDETKYESEGNVTQKTAQHKKKDKANVPFVCPVFAGYECGQEREAI